MKIYNYFINFKNDFFWVKPKPTNLFKKFEIHKKKKLKIQDLGLICQEISNIKNSAKVEHLEKLIYSTRLERVFLRNKNHLEGKLYQVLEIERE